MPDGMKKKCGILLLCISTFISYAQGLRERLIDGGKHHAALVCGHRGGFYDSLPENSMEAVDHTVAQSIDLGMVEFDIRKSKEGTLFLMHDETVDRTTNGQGKISELSDTYLKKLFLKNSKGQLTSAPVPTLEAFLMHLGKKNVLLMLDMKADVWQEAIELLREKMLVERSVVLTFTTADAKRVHELCPEIYISCLVRNESEWEAIQGLSIPNDKLIAYVNDKVSNDLILKLKNQKVPIMTDVNEHTRNGGLPLDGESYRSLLSKLKTGILITDFPTVVSRETSPH